MWRTRTVKGIRFGVLALAACTTAPPEPARLPGEPPAGRGVERSPLPGGAGIESSRPSGGAGVERELPPAPIAMTEPTWPAPPVGKPRRAMPAKPLDVAFRCAAKDERKFTTQADIEVSDGAVRYLRARLAAPDGAFCDFALSNFDQSKRMPNVELRAKRGSCVLRMWEQGPKVTLAFSGCDQFCSPGSASGRMLPVQYDRRVDRCD